MYIGKKPTAAPLTSSDVEDGIITSAKIADGTIVNADVNASAAIVASKLSGAGISVADQWRLTANITGTNAVISSNLEQCNTSAQDGASIGSAMSHSSGVWTFPSTGKYWVMFHGNGQAASAADNMAVTLDSTVNGGSNWTNIAYATDSGGGASQNQSAQMICSSFIDVTDTSNVNVRFNTSSFSSGSYLGGDGDVNYATFTFIRLGDT
tara:strand:- start:107 stop:733 length:627 start_codon:yes stop_codon:yes gene_type:complete